MDGGIKYNNAYYDEMVDARCFTLRDIAVSYVSIMSLSSEVTALTPDSHSF